MKTPFLRSSEPQVPKPVLIATDLDGTYGITPNDATVCITGRTWAEYDDAAKAVAQKMPTYLRGTGAYGDRLDAANFKVAMIKQLGVTKYYEDDPLQAGVIVRECPGVEVNLVQQWANS